MVCSCREAGGVSCISSNAEPNLFFHQQGHVSTLKELVSPTYSYLWVRPSFSSQQVAALTAEAHLIASSVLKYSIKSPTSHFTSPYNKCFRRILSISVCAFRLIKEQGEELTLEHLSKDLKTLAKQTKATKYREVMKLLRLALSGLQVLICFKSK